MLDTSMLRSISYQRHLLGRKLQIRVPLNPSVEYPVPSNFILSLVV